MATIADLFTRSSKQRKEKAQLASQIAAEQRQIQEQAQAAAAAKAERQRLQIQVQGALRVVRDQATDVAGALDQLTLVIDQGGDLLDPSQVVDAELQLDGWTRTLLTIRSGVLEIDADAPDPELLSASVAELAQALSTLRQTRLQIGTLTVKLRTEVAQRQSEQRRLATLQSLQASAAKAEGSLVYDEQVRQELDLLRQAQARLAVIQSGLGGFRAY